MSLKDEKEKKKRNQSETQSQRTQTNLKLTGTPSNTTQNNLERQELDELKTKQAHHQVSNRDTREPERTRERTKATHIEFDRGDEGFSR